MPDNFGPPEQLVHVAEVHEAEVHEAEVHEAEVHDWSKVQSCDCSAATFA